MEAYILVCVCNVKKRIPPFPLSSSLPFGETREEERVVIDCKDIEGRSRECK